MEKQTRGALKQTVWGKVFQRLITWTVYILFRPRIIWESKAAKKQLKGKPCVFVCNHTHHFDGAFAGAVLNRFKPYILVKKSWYEKKKVGTMIRWCRCMPIDLDSADADWYITAEQLMQRGGSMVIFPEGGIARSGKMEKYKPGAALLSASTGAAIVPAAIFGKYDMVFGRRMTIRIGSPIESHCPENMRHSMYAKQLMKSAESEIRRMYGDMQHQYGSVGTYPEENFAETAETTKEEQKI